MSMNPWIVVIITLVLSAFFSGMEIAFISSNKLKIEVDKTKGLLAARILSKFTTIPSRFIGALLLGNNIALVVYGIAMAIILEPLIINSLSPGFNSEYLVLLIQTVVSTILILIVAEFIPKALFRIKPNAILNIFALPLAIFYYMFYPIVYIFIGFAEWILRRLFRIKLSQEKYVFSPIDLDEYVKEFATTHPEYEVAQEIQMFQNAIEFRNVKLRECMIPRTEIVAVEKGESVEVLIRNYINTGHSKILVYEDSVDHVIGYTHSFDMFRNPKSISAVLKSIIIFPETMLASEALKMLIQEHKSVAVVVDEFGGTSGLVTLEDIIEEIFGEIIDEHDVEEFTEKKLNDQEYIFSGRLEIDYLNEKYNLNLPDPEEFETMAGLIINFHESIPKVNEEIVIDGFTITILEATKSRIEKVHLRKIG